MEKPAGTPTLDWWSDMRKVLACLAPDLATLKLDSNVLGELSTYLLSVAGKTSDRSIKDKCPLIGTALCLLHAADQLWRVDSVLRYLVDEVLCGGEAAIAEKTAATPDQNFLAFSPMAAVHTGQPSLVDMAGDTLPQPYEPPASR